jgi:hypothetical protein
MTPDTEGVGKTVLKLTWAQVSHSPSAHGKRGEERGSHGSREES